MGEFERLKSIYLLYGMRYSSGIMWTTWRSRIPGFGGRYGQCNTKGTLFMALAACGIPCRVHGFTIDKKLQKGAMTALCNASKRSAECSPQLGGGLSKTSGYELEAFILDSDYLHRLQRSTATARALFAATAWQWKDFSIRPSTLTETHVYSERGHQSGFRGL